MKIYRSKVHGGAPIYFGEETRELLLGEVEEIAPDRLFVITDHTVEALYMEEFRELLPFAAEPEVITLPEGERSKNLSTLQQVAGDLIRGDATKNSLVLNVGGGTVLDMGALAASVVSGGVPFAHFATTFNASWQVVPDDRQAIHFVGQINAFGVHRAPKFSIIDPKYFESEEERAFRASAISFAQHALVAGGQAFDKGLEIFSDPEWFEVANHSKALGSLLDIKLESLQGMESRSRAELARNYGAPLAKAIEILTDGRIDAGDALYFGMEIAAEVAKATGHMSEAAHEKHAKLLSYVGTATPFPEQIRTDRLIFQLHGNDKTLEDGNRLVLLAEPGEIATSDASSAPDESIAVDDLPIAQAIEKLRARNLTLRNG